MEHGQHNPRAPGFVLGLTERGDMDGAAQRAKFLRGGGSSAAAPRDGGRVGRGRVGREGWSEKNGFRLK